MAQATCRIPAALDDALDEAAAEVGLFRSDVFRRALVHYMKTNPDQLRTFTGRDIPGGVRTIKSRENRRTGDRGEADADSFLDF